MTDASPSSRFETVKAVLDLSPRLIGTLVAVFLVFDNYAAVQQIITTLAQPENSEKILSLLVGEKEGGGGEEGSSGEGKEGAGAPSLASGAHAAYVGLMKAAAHLGGEDDDPVVALAKDFKDLSNRAAAAGPEKQAAFAEELRALQARREALVSDYAAR